MTDDPIPDEVQDLLRQFRSASQIEVLSLLVADQRVWTPPEVASELRFSAGHARQMLEALVPLGLVVHAGEGFTVLEARPRNVALAAQLVESYKRYPVRVIGIVFAKPSKAVRDFADAFRLRPPDQEEKEE